MQSTFNIWNKNLIVTVWCFLMFWVFDLGGLPLSITVPESTEPTMQLYKLVVVNTSLSFRLDFRIA